MPDSFFEVYPTTQRREGGWLQHPLLGRVETPAVDELTGEYGWRFKDAEGTVMATGYQGFKERKAAHRAVDAFKEVTGIGWDQHGEPFDPAVIDVDQ